MKLIYYIVRDIIVILLALLAVYTITHKEEVVKVSVDSYLPTRDFEDYWFTPNK